LFLRTTLVLYQDTATDKSYPVHNPKTQDPETEYQGELLDFWKACCAPLNIPTTDAGLDYSYRKIVKV
jgi:hypothetical protein